MMEVWLRRNPAIAAASYTSRPLRRRLRRMAGSTYQGLTFQGMTFQSLILKLNAYWAGQGCVLI